MSYRYNIRKTPCIIPQVNGTVEAIKNILEHVLTKVCNASHDYWDLNIPIFSWAYRTTCKILIGKTPFKLVYGKEAIIPMEYIVPSLCIAAAMGMDDKATLEERVVQLIQLEEDRFIAGFHQRIEKDQQKAWHDCYIKNKQF